jgi:hypothetical protein
LIVVTADEEGAAAEVEAVFRLMTVSAGTRETTAGDGVADAEGPLSAMVDVAAAGVVDDELASDVLDPESVVVVETETNAEAPESELLAVTKTVLVLVRSPSQSSVLVAFRAVSEPSWPVMPPFTPDSANLLCTSSTKSQARVVPGLFTRGRAKQEVLVEQGMTSQVPPEHWANEEDTQACSPSLQGSEAFKVANFRFKAWASRPFCNLKSFARGSRPANKVGAALMGESKSNEVTRTVKNGIILYI